MVIGDILREATEKLASAGIKTPRLDAEVLLAHLLKQERLYLLLHRSDRIDDALYDRFCQFINRRAQHEPIAYLIGNREFMSLSFAVAPGVLIPRPDTETLVECILKIYDKKSAVTILDLCTGSGAVAISLGYYLPNSRITGIDISSLCVATAQKNAEQNGVSQRVVFEQADVLHLPHKSEPYDCIVSNPPYIPTEVLKTLAPDVQDYEPHLALDGGDDGLLFYRHIVNMAPPMLKPGGWLALETGHDQGQIVADLMLQTGMFENIQIRQDLSGIGRVAFGALKE